MESAPHDPVDRWMTQGVVATSPETVLFDAFELMQEHRIRHLPVLEGGDLVGMLSTRDALRILRRAESEPARAGLQPLHRTRVREVMSSPVRTVDRHTPVREAIEILCREKISALPVLEGGEVVGIVTTEDLLWSTLERGDPEDF
ncbi:MAG: CBS domain-containing protein [Planctomycetota bacterium]|nr:MAG: CBS domain-containing protein [Planctomycetota bacterium]